MKRGALFAAMISVFAAPAWAGTYYAYAPVQDSIFAIDPASITTNGEVKTATIYFVHPTRTAEASEIDFDCANQTLTTKSRKLIRTDLSPLRNAKITTPSGKPTPKTTGDISLKLVCEWPKPSEKPIKMEEPSLGAFLAKLSDTLRKRAKYTPDIVIDQTSVGNCIFSKVPKDVSFNALMLMQQNKPLGADQQIRAEIGKAAEACGVAPAYMDASVFAAQGIYGRYGILSVIPDKKGQKLREDVFAAAWNGADASAREPFLALAALAMVPASTVDDVVKRRDSLVEAGKTLAANPELQAAVKKASSRKADEITLLLRQYFAATAMGEVAEAKLAPP
jgi:hypothetical protein